MLLRPSRIVKLFFSYRHQCCSDSPRAFAPRCIFNVSGGPEQEVVAKDDEEEATFKQFKRYDNMKILHPLNPRYNDIVLNKDKEYRIVGVVMEKKKRYK